MIKNHLETQMETTLQNQLSVRQVAKILSISTRKVYRLIQERKLPIPIKIGTRSCWLESDVLPYQKILQTQREKLIKEATR